MAPAERQVLVVRHGPGRGRAAEDGPYASALLRNAPDWVRFHHTGAPAPDLDGVRGLLFLLADPLHDLYPDCFAEATDLAQEARRRDITVANPPEVLAHYAKSSAAERWLEEDLPTPECRAFARASELPAAAQGLRAPLIVRGDKAHGQVFTRLLRRPDDWVHLPAEFPLPGVVSSLIDVRTSHPADAPLYRTLFHKRRAFVFGSEVCPGYSYFSEQPVVGGRSSILKERARRALAKRRPRSEVEQLAQLALQEDRRFGTSAVEHATILVAAARALNVQFGAFDYAVLGSGEIRIWELNPYPTFTSLMDTDLAEPRQIPARLDALRLGCQRFLAGLAGRA